MSDCLFCQIVAGNIPADIIYQNDTVLAFKDIAPQAPFHALIIPKQHIVNINDLDDSSQAVMGDIYLAAKHIANEAGYTDYRVAMNCGAGAGQTVFHMHLHVLAGRDFTWPPG